MESFGGAKLIHFTIIDSQASAIMTSTLILTTSGYTYTSDMHAAFDALSLQIYHNVLQ